jgi:predicted component of type VI protein secretion system
MRKKKVTKNKGLFDHITHITQRQTKGYWDSLNETEKKQWSNYMIHRFLSMKMDYVEVVNELQRYNLKPKEYVKGKKTMKYQTWLLEIVAKYYESSISEAHDYLEIYYSSEQGKADLKSILQKYGVEPKEIKKLNLP